MKINMYFKKWMFPMSVRGAVPPLPKKQTEN